jgi:hypothetical protein
MRHTTTHTTEPDKPDSNPRRRSHEAVPGTGRGHLNPISTLSPPAEFRLPLAAAIVDSSERIRLALLAHLRTRRISRKKLAVLVRGAGYRLDVNRLLTGRSSFEVSRLLSVLDILQLNPRSFFSLIWTAPAIPSPLFRQLRELLSRAPHPSSRAIAPPDPSTATPAAKTERIRLLLLRLVAIRRITREELRRQLVDAGVRIDVHRVLSAANRLHVEDLIAMVAVLGLHPLELVRILWKPPAGPALQPPRRSNPATAPTPLPRQASRNI